MLTEAELDVLEFGPNMVKVADDAMKIKREKELELLKEFKKNPSQETFMPLYTSFKPAIISAMSTNSHRSPLPQAAHMAYAAQNFLESIRRYDPSKGTFRYHAMNTVRQAGKRLNLKYQNIGYIPEGRAVKYQTYQNALYHLREMLGRDPTTAEIADEITLPLSEVEKLQREVKKDLYSNENFLGRGNAINQSNAAMTMLHDIRPTLTRPQQAVLDYTAGMYGKKALVKSTGRPDIPAIAKATGLPLAQVRSIRKTLARAAENYQKKINIGEHISDHVDGEDED